ncbi:MAG TPA: ABC transporter ATP-binding protein [Opitutaceae bacterium]|nr:ABC transporter ATP-binding protein [Opitutaceae bacterium]
MTQEAAPPIVELRDVDKRYGDGPLILDRVSFTAERGEFITLIGPSGCGKSTVLRLISGLIPVTSGRIVVDGEDPSSATERLAFVFQEPTLLPWLNVSRNVEVPLRLHGTGAARRSEIVGRTLALVRLADRADYYPRQLSGGQKMRVSIARALGTSPRILLLDEPFGALDEITRNHLNEELLAIRQQLAWTAFFVTHSVAEAVFLSSRIIVMAANPGRLHKELAVDLPYPRTEETRESQAYQRLVGEVSGILRSVEELKP